MSTILKKRRSLWPKITAERLIACGAVAVTAAGFAQPQIMSLAGLSFDRTPKMFAGKATDPMPTGTIAGPESHDVAAARRSDAIVHGLAGTLRALRGKE